MFKKTLDEGLNFLIWPVDSWKDNFPKPCNTQGINYHGPCSKKWPHMSWKSKLVWKWGMPNMTTLKFFSKAWDFSHIEKTQTIQPWAANCIVTFRHWSWQQWPNCRLRVTLVTEELRLLLRANTQLPAKKHGAKTHGAVGCIVGMYWG